MPPGGLCSKHLNYLGRLTDVQTRHLLRSALVPRATPQNHVRDVRQNWTISSVEHIESALLFLPFQRTSSTNSSKIGIADFHVDKEY